MVRLWILAQFVGFLALAVSAVILMAGALRAMRHKEDSGEDTEFGLGEDAGTPAPDAVRVAWTRTDAETRAAQAFLAVRVRMEQRRAEHRRIRPFLSGPPIEDDPLDLDAITTAADRVMRSAQRCQPRDAA